VVVVGISAVVVVVGTVVVVVSVVEVVVELVVVLVVVEVVVVGQSGISFTTPVSTHLLPFALNWHDSGEQK